MPARCRQVEILQALCERFRVHPVVANRFGIEAVGLDFLVTDGGDSAQRAIHVLPHWGADREQLQAKLVAARWGEHERGRRVPAGLLQEMAAAHHAPQVYAERALD